MSRWIQWLAGLMLGGVLLLVAGVFALQRWVGTDDVRLRLEREATAALGLGVTLGQVGVELWPLPAVALEGVKVLSQPPLTLARVELRPAWGVLLRGRLEVATLVVRRAVLPQPGIDAVLASLQKKKQSTPAAPGLKAENASSLAGLPRRTVLDGVSWLNSRGASTTLNAEARLGADGWPEAASFQVVQGVWQGTQGSLQRDGQEWAVRVAVGGGTVRGKLGLQLPSGLPGPAGRDFVLQGQLDTRDVEVAALTAPQRPLSGRLDASTTLHARATSSAALVDVLRTRTRFTVRNAMLHGLDLLKAVQTVGLSRGGETRLDTLAGQVSTQGRALQLSNLVAGSGLLTASGNVAVSPARALSGRISVDAAGGAVGVPLAVSGTLDAPELMLTRGALLGAAIGTAVMPGVGTGAGARFGDRVGQSLQGLFGK